METSIIGSSGQGITLSMLEPYNTCIRQFQDDRYIFVADLGKAAIQYETADGIHPTKQGHKDIANAWIKAMNEFIS